MHRQTLNIEAVLFGWDAQERPEMRVSHKPPLKGAAPLAQPEPGCLSLAL
jgi:hypothetical protein